MNQEKMIGVGDMIWNPKTKLSGKVVRGEGADLNGQPIPAAHVAVSVEDALAPGGYSLYVWHVSSVELLDEEEFKLVAELVRCKRLKTELNKQVKEAQAAYGAADEAMLAFLDRMAAQGTRQYAGVGQVTIDGVEVHPSITEEDRETAYAEIEAMGRGEIIKRTIHPSTLEAFVNELKDTGVPVPAHIKVFERPKLSFAKKK